MKTQNYKVNGWKWIHRSFDIPVKKHYHKRLSLQTLSVIGLLLWIITSSYVPEPPAPRIRNTKITKLTVVEERVVVPGVTYTEYKTNGTYSIRVHVVELDKSVPGNGIRVLKGKRHAAGREMLRDMSRRYELESSNAVLGLVNANFWAAVRNNPIGPTVIDGEVVEMLPYKGWSSAFFDVGNRIVIDTIRMQGNLKWGKLVLPIGSTNRRLDSTDVVLFNLYGGATVPFVTPDQVQWLFNEALKDTVFMGEDSTEVELSQETLRHELERAKRESSIEHPKKKVRLRYLRAPSVNRSIPCVVLGSDTGTVETPLRGCILSFDASLYPNLDPNRGDTVWIRFSTNTYSDRRFMNAVCGTPRLVRGGVAGHEASEEGVRSRRFIQHNLPRTALGTDRKGEKLTLVAIAPGSKSARTTGASLAQMAQIMKLLDCYDAINLDGGGSTGMIVENEHAFLLNNPDTRPVSVGLGIVRLHHILRSQRSYSR